MGAAVTPVVVVPAVVAGPAWAGDACVRFSVGVAIAEAVEIGAARLGVPAPNWPVLAGDGLPEVVVEAAAADGAAAGPVAVVAAVGAAAGGASAGEGAATAASGALTAAAAGAAGAATAAASPGTGDRGATWVTGACCPTPDTDSPRPPTLAFWPAPTSVC